MEIANQNNIQNSEQHKITKTKRMLLSEVYVHKCFKKSKTSSDGEETFEVFHIFEVSDSDGKIIPKLSTNCSEPAKVIDILQNFTGSETPQLQRLIEKLCAQSKSSCISMKFMRNNIYFFYKFVSI